MDCFDLVNISERFLEIADPSMSEKPVTLSRDVTRCQGIYIKGELLRIARTEGFRLAYVVRASHDDRDTYAVGIGWSVALAQRKPRTPGA